MAYYARLEVGGRSHHQLRKRVLFTLAMDDGARVRVRAQGPRLGPLATQRGPCAELRTKAFDATFEDLDLDPAAESELRRVAVRAGDRVVVEGIVTHGKSSRGYRGPKTVAPESIDAVAIGIGDEATAFLDDEVSRRRRAALLAELGTLRRFRDKLRRPLIALAVGLVLLATGGLLALLDVPAPGSRYFTAAFGLQLCLGALAWIRFGFGWSRARDPASAKTGALTTLCISTVIIAMLGLNVAGGAASHARYGMVGVPFTGLVVLMATWSRPRKDRVSLRWAHRLTLTLAVLSTALGGLFTVRSIAQDHYHWAARVTSSERSDVHVGTECTVDVAYAPRGFASASAQCETDVRCGDVWLYGEYQGFIECERSADGFHGADLIPSDGDGVVELDGTSGSSDGVVFEGLERD